MTKVPLENKIIDVAGTLNQRFLMLVQALSGIRALTSVTIDNSEENNLVQNALQVISQNLDLERCSIFLLNDNGELYCVRSKDWSDSETKPISNKKSHTFRLGEGIIGKAAESRQIYHCKNCKQDKNYLAIIDPKTASYTGSLLCAPIISGEELLGVLNVSHPEPYFFHPWQEHVISIHANILAQMLHNHRLMKDMAAQVSSKTRELQVSLDETQQLESKYKTLSLVDDLTQVHNRRYFFSEVPSSLARALRYHHPLGLLFIDLDHFKSVNDTYGHDIGDLVLMDVASVLSKQCRKGDILARMGGEEFAMVVSNTTTAGIKLLAQRIKDSVSRITWDHEDLSFGVTLSIGISELKFFSDNDPYLDHTNEIVRILVREADEALYHCKNTGRDKIAFYHESHNGPTE